MLWKSVMIKDILSSRNIINEIINLAKLMIKDILSSWNIINESINLAKFYSKFLFFHVHPISLTRLLQWLFTSQLYFQKPTFLGPLHPLHDWYWY